MKIPLKPPLARYRSAQFLNNERILSTDTNPQVYICNGGADNNGIHYGDIQEDTAIKYYGRAKTSQGKSGYPKTFANQGELLKFPSVCNNTEVWELPVLASGKPFDITKKKSKKEQNHPGPMRVYYTKDLEFCTIGARMYQNDTGNPHNCDLKAKE